MRRNGLETLSLPAISLPEKSTHGQLSMFGLMTCEDLTSATSSPESADGPLPRASPGGRMTAQSGPVPPPAKTTRLPAPYGAFEEASTGPAAPWCDPGWISSPQGCQAMSLLKTCLASPRRLPKSRDVWRALAITWPDPNERLPILVRLIADGESGLLPTVTARDWKNPGRADHARLSSTRGEPLPETFGLPLPTALAGWLMGFPPEWLQSAPMETPSTRGSRRR